MNRRWGPPSGRRPPWWPEGEPFPPARWNRSRRGPAVFMRWIGCLFIASLGFAALGGGVIGAFIGRVGFLPVFVLGVVLILVFATVITSGMRRMAWPMDRLIEAAARIEAGDYAITVPERGPRELRSVARAFNSMSARLKTIDEQRRGFLADVAHELRTPLSVIRGQAEAIADGVYPGDSTHLAPILDATQTLDRLVEDLRTMVLADAGDLDLRKEAVDMGALVRDTVDSFRAQADSAGVSLSSEAADNLPMLELDPARIRSALGNLISNSIRHTPSGGSVKLSTTSSGERIVTTVADTGVGIPAEVLPHVFDRFVRGPGSTGSGLGLAIARDIVTAHGGTLEIESKPGAGTTARLSLPVAPHA